MKDIFPSFIMASVMCIIVLLVGNVGFGPLVTLIIQVITGVGVYLLLSVVVKPRLKMR